ncbi:3'(2'),5'-bisphosphate nucleotidase CysQ [Methylocapsa acidiphila]|uniref:3'(2'),5'-bisphosphate nucleotidase CysQ n=1 Tax=Methylocapsa acidiphila TaxID=133552 RepID=UPI001FDA6AC6|nr:3'(2'),5'-bisphosphate nucleotidase CysQ [Methylocapsa acidiphila]
MSRRTDLSSITHADDLVASFADAARSAGELALAYFRPGEKTSAEVLHKAGGSPVTEADLLVDRFLKERLGVLLPEAGWLSEETEDTSARLAKEFVVVVDPIDGTRGFARGDLVWAVAVALVRNGKPLVGIVHAPALAQTYVAVRGGGARLNGKTIEVSKLRALRAGARVAAPATLAADLRRAGLEFELQPRIPSLAMRIAAVASGALDAGFASQNSNDWDIAAADLILEEAGGRLASLDGCAIVYNRGETRHGVLTAAPAQIHAEVNAAARRAMGAIAD